MAIPSNIERIAFAEAFKNNGRVIESTASVSSNGVSKAKISFETTDYDVVIVEYNMGKLRYLG